MQMQSQRRRRRATRSFCRCCCCCCCGCGFCEVCVLCGDVIAPPAEGALCACARVWKILNLKSLPSALSLNANERLFRLSVDLPCAQRHLPAARPTALECAADFRLCVTTCVIVVRYHFTATAVIAITQARDQEREKRTSRRRTPSFNEDNHDALLLVIRGLFVGPCWGGSCWRIRSSP
jgi:hypothetical protein